MPLEVEMNSESETSNPRMSKGNLGCHEYIVGFTPVDDILHIDKDEPNADITGVKYSKHRTGDKRPTDAGSDDQCRITMIVKGGPWKQQMWLDGQDRETIELTKEGDYIAWEPGYCHNWEAIGDTTMLTVSFRRRNTDV
jgi:hypothetical protein